MINPHESEIYKHEYKKFENFWEVLNPIYYFCYNSVNVIGLSQKKSKTLFNKHFKCIREKCLLITSIFKNYQIEK